MQISKNIVLTAEILGKYDWKKARYPKKEWSVGVGEALSKFALMELAATPSSIIDGIFSFFGADPPLVQISNLMIKVAKKLDEYSWDSLNYPKKEDK